MTPEQALQTAFAIVGSKAKMAREVGVTPQSINDWKVAPADRVLAIMGAVTRARSTIITPYDLRPDVYPKEKEKG